MQDLIANDDKVVGIKQTKKAIKEGRARKVYLALNSDIIIRDVINNLCKQANLPVVEVETMQELGSACDIQVGAACAAIL
ncbi:MAG: ribosomal L7Ae/L30e/S12e/Gadd45 family protein [Clostridia bacterium]|nr:ribosomal L7Ae/L30e/S12e/Gadd45 family protein [Clostridia bacterium]